jgi:hypothetical protein
MASASNTCDLFETKTSSLVLEDFFEKEFILSILVDIVTTKRDKRVLVFVNPAGGAGKAYRLVMEYVVGVWSEAEFNYQIVVTGFKIMISKLSIDFCILEYAGHARDYVQSLDISEWSGIVVASGDGLVYEVNISKNINIIMF